jgi:hypothetical protein
LSGTTLSNNSRDEARLSTLIRGLVINPTAFDAALDGSNRL